MEHGEHDREAEPEVGDWVKGEGLVVLRGSVVKTIEEEPWGSMVDGLGFGCGEIW